MGSGKSGLIFFLLILLIPAFGANRKNEQPGEAEQATIRADVEMVSLPVVVSDQDGRRITGLKKEDFQVFENGVQQEIAGFGATDEPVDVALVLDTSGSTERKLAKIQNAAITFVHQLHPDDEVAIVSFADDVKLQSDFTIDRNRNEYGIKKTRSGGCTVEYEAVWLALEDVLKPVKERKALVLFTDGVDTCSSKASMKETLDLARETRATIYCVYYNTEDDQYGRRPLDPYPTTPSSLPPIIIGGPQITRRPGGIPPNSPGSMPSDYVIGRDYLEKLAEYSGGRFFDGMQDLSYAFAEVAKELSNQYSIGYYPQNSKHDGKFRKIEIKVTRPGLSVRTKKGYFAKKDKK